FYITYTIYEPGEASCDDRWYDAEHKQWVTDRGATYEVRFRLVVAGDGDFDFGSNFQLPKDYGDGFGSAGGLSGPVIEQVGGCDDGNCGAVLRTPSSAPCNPNDEPSIVAGLTSIQTGYGELDGFSPLEIPL
ncbi:MAG: hypothetical protein KC431_30840, partial [Myxococcales bacterium]|nr:hypothetical protein [Myxococcales bacterium]